MCKCHSYNKDNPDSEKDMEVILTPPEQLGIGRDSVCVDACISNVINHLWDSGIATLNSCCGHNKEMPSIVIQSGCNEEIAEIVKRKIAEVDPRQFTIMSWCLVRF